MELSLSKPPIDTATEQDEDVLFEMGLNILEDADGKLTLVGDLEEDLTAAQLLQKNTQLTRSQEDLRLGLESSAPKPPRMINIKKTDEGWIYGCSGTLEMRHLKMLLRTGTPEPIFIGHLDDVPSSELTSLTNALKLTQCPNVTVMLPYTCSLQCLNLITCKKVKVLVGSVITVTYTSVYSIFSGPDNQAGWAKAYSMVSDILATNLVKLKVITEEELETLKKTDRLYLKNLKQVND